MIASAFASRARQGGAALARPFDGSNLDLTTGPAPGVTLTPLGQTATTRFQLGSTESGQSDYIGNSLTDTLVRFADVQAHQLAFYQDGATFQNVDTDVQIYNYDSTAAPGAIVNCRVCTDINAQYLSGATTGAIDAGGLVKNVDISGTSEDGIYPGYDCAKNGLLGAWSPVENLYAIGPGAFNFYGEYPYGGFPYGGPWPWAGATTNTGALLTKAQIQGATTWVDSSPGAGQVGPGGTVTAQQLISLNTHAIGPAIYQVLTGGTLGTEDASGATGSSPWPTSTANMWSNGATTFTSGTATIAYLAPGIHSDGIQTTGRQCVAVRHSFVADFANSCILIQNAAGNSNPTPLANWVVEDSVFRSAGNYAFYVQSQTQDANYSYPGSATHNQQGPFTRVSATDWTTASNPGKSRPWHVSFRRLTMLTALAGPQAGVTCTMQQCMSGNGIVWVDSEARRDQLIANQYGWDTGDQRLAMMRAGLYDYVNTGFPAPISSVMENRLQAAITAMTGSGSGYTGGTSSAFSATPGALAGQCVGVWERNIRDQNGNLIYPASGSVPVPASTAVTDAQGYYTGS